MLSIDVSKAVPHNALAYLTLLIPGCFFEVSVLLANPQLIAKQVSALHQTFPISPYLLLSLAFFIAFIIGSAAIVFVGLLIRILKGLYAIRTSLVTATLTTLLRVIAKRTPLTTTPLHKAFKRRSDADNAGRAWRRLAAKLLLDPYGIQPRHIKTDWIFYMVAHADLSHEEVTGNIMVHVLHATGWCGLVATLLAPALRPHPVPYAYSRGTPRRLYDSRKLKGPLEHRLTEYARRRQGIQKRPRPIQTRRLIR